MTAQAEPLELVAETGFWSKEWAAVVGGDGHLITDLLGRVAPNIDDATADRFKHAEIHDPGVRRAQETANMQGWRVADANGLRTALAQAYRAADLVADTLAPYDRNDSHNDRWHRWQPCRRALHGVVAALVIRQHAAGLADILAALWVQVVGELPPVDDLAAAQDRPQRCYECGTPQGVELVTSAEAARYARHLESGLHKAAEWAKEDAEKARRMLADYTRTHLDPAVVRDTVVRALDAVSISAKARREIEQRLGITALAPVHVPAVEAQPLVVDETEQGGLFDVEKKAPAEPPAAAALAPQVTSRPRRIETAETTGALL